MSKFYTAVAQYGNSIIVKEVVDGKHKIKKIPYQPSYYVRTREESQFHTMEGDPLKKITFNDINEAKDYVKKYKDVENHEFFGNTNLVYQYICDAYPGSMDFDLTQLGIWSVDIETKVELGFPHPEEAAEEILLITMQNNITKQFLTWGRKPFDIDEAKKLDVDFDITSIDLDYRYFKEEADLLNDFLYWWKNATIDCLTDWNGESFDIPYLHNRIMRVLGDAEVKVLSPFRIVRDRLVRLGDKEFTTYDFLGIAHLDYLQLYKKFGSYNAKESYKLDYIGQLELGISKIDVDYATGFKQKYSGEFDITTPPDDNSSETYKLAYKRTLIKQELIKRGVKI